MTRPVVSSDSTKPSSRLEGPLLVDGHVHFHDCFGEGEFFDHAATNFQHAARQLYGTSHAVAVLLFGERSGDDYFQRLRRAAEKQLPAGWRIEETDEDCSLIADRGRQLIALISGQQVATRERLEVLAMGTARRFPDGESLSDTLGRVRDTGGLATIPWGFGKWWLRRGSLVQRAIEAGSGDWLFLGDSGQRPWACRRPALFRTARSRGILTLAGSDPLPAKRQVERVGSYGFTLDGSLGRERPSADLKRMLRNLDGQPAEFGVRASLRAFAGIQLEMIRRRLVPGGSRRP